MNTRNLPRSTLSKYMHSDASLQLSAGSNTGKYYNYTLQTVKRIFTFTLFEGEGRKINHNTV
jgi:hypothetical protein